MLKNRHLCWMKRVSIHNMYYFPIFVLNLILFNYLNNKKYEPGRCKIFFLTISNFYFYNFTKILGHRIHLHQTKITHIVCSIASVRLSYLLVWQSIPVWQNLEKEIFETPCSCPKKSTVYTIGHSTSLQLNFQLIPSMSIPIAV